jgi:hypothetical protein
VSLLIVAMLRLCVTAPAANDLANTAADLLKQDLTNFLLSIPFAADFTRIKSVIRTDSDASWITNEIAQINPFQFRF